jgi:hypothetical protein
VQLAEKSKEEIVSKPKEMVAVNERGRRIGESHPRAKLDDHEIDLLQELLEGGMSLREAADKFDISKAHAGRIKLAKARAQYPARFKRAK